MRRCSAEGTAAASCLQLQAAAVKKASTVQTVWQDFGWHIGQPCTCFLPAQMATACPMQHPKRCSEALVARVLCKLSWRTLARRASQDMHSPSPNNCPPGHGVLFGELFGIDSVVTGTPPGWKGQGVTKGTSVRCCRALAQRMDVFHARDWLRTNSKGPGRTQQHRHSRGTH